MNLPMASARSIWWIIATAALSLLTGLGVGLATDWPVRWRGLLQMFFALALSLLLVALIRLMGRWLERTLRTLPGGASPGRSDRPPAGNGSSRS